MNGWEIATIAVSVVSIVSFTLIADFMFQCGIRRNRRERELENEILELREKLITAEKNDHRDKNTGQFVKAD